MPNLRIDDKGEVYLTDDGARVVHRGGDDAVNGEEMVLLEIVHRAPGMTRDDLQSCFIAIMQQYGADALKAIRSGHVKFEKREC